MATCSGLTCGKSSRPNCAPATWSFASALSSHKVSGVREAVAECGASLLYLPADSPDLNPIELAFAKLKAFLRQRAQRNFAGLRRATAQALDSFTAAHCTNFFRHAQYATD